MAARKWSPEQRAAQSKAIHSWEPWTKSTGAKTALGKAKVARNAYRGGSRQLARFARWVFKAIDHPESLTPEIIEATKIRCNKLVDGNISWLDKVNAELDAKTPASRRLAAGVASHKINSHKHCHKESQHD